jgi:hypothetical protein
MVIEMVSIRVNSAKSFIGRNVNLHLRDGAVIVNVQLTALLKGAGKNSILEYTPTKRRKINRILLRYVAYAEILNPNLLQTAS